jgi:hypothetical protein
MTLEPQGLNKICMSMPVNKTHLEFPTIIVPHRFSLENKKITRRLLPGHG